MLLFDWVFLLDRFRFDSFLLWVSGFSINFFFFFNFKYDLGFWRTWFWFRVTFLVQHHPSSAPFNHSLNGDFDSQFVLWPSSSLQQHILKVCKLFSLFKYCFCFLKSAMFFFPFNLVMNLWVSFGYFGWVGFDLGFWVRFMFWVNFFLS